MDNAANFENDDFNISTREKTDASVAWSPVDWESNESGPAQQTVDLSTIVQEIINREGSTVCFYH